VAPDHESDNIADFLPDTARLRPDDVALYQPCRGSGRGQRAYTHLTFSELNAETDMIAYGLIEIGMRQGDRCAVLLKPGLSFFTVMFALLKAGIVPVLIDPGIGFRPMKQCLAEVAPRGFIGIPVAHIARILLGWARHSIEIAVTVGPRLFFAGHNLDQVRRMGRIRGPFPIHKPAVEEIAAILFTSGSTGLPKGVVYTHQVFQHQVAMIRDMFGMKPGEIDIPTFPPFALFDPALGVTAVIPDMEARYPAKASPANIYRVIEDFGATTMFASPALLNTLSRDGSRREKKLPTLRRVISAGAPASPAVLEGMAAMLAAETQIFTPYGATECMPVSLIGSREVLQLRDRMDRGEGICVGRPVSGMAVFIIAISDEEMPEFRKELVLKEGEIGEIVVRGPVVTGMYFNRAEATRMAKMRDSGGQLYHRMGDVGYFDAEGRLWFCGRKAHRVKTTTDVFYTIPCEAVFNTHPAVFRSALVGVETGNTMRPVMCIELEHGQPKPDWSKLEQELRTTGAGFPHTREIEDFLVHPGFPVDRRHNSKIRREDLAVWARKRLS